jgi:farnesyl-diphosphate farnesyltransferase
MSNQLDALELLKNTSRTFYIPIIQLPPSLREAVASAYLCMRAIDQIEDHPTLDPQVKAHLLHEISLLLQEQRSHDDFAHERFSQLFQPYLDQLEEVTVRIADWACYAPKSIAFRIWDITAAMADRMAHWSKINWQIRDEQDLDRYTFSVAGAVGLLLSDLWAWYDGTQSDRTQAIGFGRGLQTVNILRNRNDDLSESRDFFPAGWQTEDLFDYARRNLKLADQYIASLPEGPALTFCKLPLVLAHRTLAALEAGHSKLSRNDVLEILQEVGYA